MKNPILICCLCLACACILVARAQNPQTEPATTPLARERPAPVSPANAKPAQEATPQNAEARENDPRLDAINIVNAAAARPRPLRLLVVGAHPADVFDQSGGTMAHHIQRGDWVGCAVMTTGVRVHDKVVANELEARQEIPESEELKQIFAERTKVKEEEVLKACALLGVRAEDVHFLGADDAVLLVNEPMIHQIARLIRQLRPDVLITHFPFEDAGLGAHAVTGQMVVQALSAAAGVAPGDKRPPHNVAQVFFFGIGAAAVRTHLWSSRGGFYNDVFVDITDVAAKKIACLDAMASQGYAGAYARKRIDSSDGAFGNRMRIPYAEGFITLYSTVHYYLPVSPIDLEHAKSSDQNSITRKSYRISVP
jgi:4-oxalomesaconate hydratase